MATRKSTKSAPVEETVEIVEDSPKKIINDLIAQTTKDLGLLAKDRYKVQRALGYVAFLNCLEAGTLDDLVSQMIEMQDELPFGYTLEKVPAKEKPAPAEKVIKTPDKAPAKAATKTPAKSGRRRPVRSKAE